MAYLKLPLPYCCDFLPSSPRNHRQNAHAEADPLKYRHQQEQHSRRCGGHPGFESRKTRNPNHRAHAHNNRHRRLDRRKMPTDDMGNAKQVAPDEPADDQPEQKHRQRSPCSYARPTQAQRNHSPARQSLDHMPQNCMACQSNAQDQSKTHTSAADRTHHRRARFFLRWLRQIRSVRRSAHRLARRQPSHNLFHHRIRPCGNLLRCLVLYRMLHINSVKARAAQCASLNARRGRELCSGHRHCGDAQIFQVDRVVQTARCARSSIRQPFHHCVHSA
jgi:hypothetical protein